MIIPIPWNKDRQAVPKCNKGQAVEIGQRKRIECRGYDTWHHPRRPLSAAC